MTDFLEDYLRAVRHNLRTDEPTKEHIIRELRGHLEEKARDLSRDHPDMAGQEVARRVVHEMGNPHDLALAYGGPEPTLVRASTGEVVLRAGRAVGRGTRAMVKGFFKGLAIALAFLLILATGLGVWAFYEVKPLVEKNAPYPLYAHNKDCSNANCTTGLVEQVFDVHEGAREVRLDVDIWFPRDGAGTLELTILDTNGTPVYQRAFNATGGSSTGDDLRWSARPGPWTVAYRYDGFRGQAHVEVLALGLPRDAT